MGFLFYRYAEGCCLALQEAQYIPGPWLKEGKNEMIFLEVEKSPSEATGALSQLPEHQHSETPLKRSCRAQLLLLMRVCCTCCACRGHLPCLALELHNATHQCLLE